MAGWLDELFNGAQFKGQDPKGLLEMLTQLAQTQAGPSAGFAPAGPQPGGPMMPLPMPPAQYSGGDGGPMMPLPRGPAPGPPPPDTHLPMPPNRAPVDALPVPPPPGAGPRSFDNAYFDPATYQGVGARDQLPPAMAQMAGATPGPAPAGWRSLYFPPDARAEAPGAAASQPPAPPTQPEGPGMLERVGRHILQTLHDNSNSMIAGGGAMISGGLGHGLSAMAAAAPLDIAARRERQGNEAIQATYNALIQAGHSPAAALAGSQNKEILATLVAKPTWGVIGEDPFTGAKRYGFIDPISQTTRSPGNAGGGGSDMSNIDSSKMGDEYLAQFPKEAQARILDYYNNRVAGSQPKGKVEPVLKYAAEKYAQDKGHPIDDISVAERRKMMLDIEDNKFSSIGGSKTNANASLKHLAESSDYAVRMDTMGNIAGIPALAHGYNIVRNQFGDKSAIAQGLFDANYTFGGEKTKFLTGAQGTHDERLQYTKLFGPEKTPLEKAEVYAAERKLLVDKLVSNQDKIERSIPASERAKAPEKFRMFEPETVKLIEKLDRNIAILRGEAKAGPEPVRVQSVAEARKLPKGTPIILPDGSPGVVP